MAGISEVVFRANVMKLISFSRQVSMTLGEKWHPRLSPVITFGPRSFSLDFKNISQNYFSKVFISNHPQGVES